MTGVTYEADSHCEEGVAGVDVKGGAVVFFGKVELVLYFIHSSQSVPAVVMPLICTDCVSESKHSFVQFFVRDVFVSLEGIRICEFGIELCRPREAFDRLIVVPLEGQCVPESYPGLRR